MVQALPLRSTTLTTCTNWIDICSVNEIAPNTGVCALIEGEQIAIFRVGYGSQLYAISNYDPFSNAFVLSRGIIGDRNGIPKVASPIYKQNFNLLTGECFDDETVKVLVYPVQVVGDRVQVAIAAPVF